MVGECHQVSPIAASIPEERVIQSRAVPIRTLTYRIRRRASIEKAACLDRSRYAGEVNGDRQGLGIFLSDRIRHSDGKRRFATRQERCSRNHAG